jgi:hypothetical protein
MAQIGRLQVRTIIPRVVVFLAIVLSLAALALRLAPNGSQPIAAAVGVATSGCATLSPPPLSSAWELSSRIDRERGTIFIEIFGSSDWAATVSYTDPICLAHGVLGPIIAEHLEDARIDQITECADLARRVASGRVVMRGQELDIDKVRAHIDRWC